MYGGGITRANPSKFSFCGLGREIMLPLDATEAVSEAA